MKNNDDIEMVRPLKSAYRPGGWGDIPGKTWPWVPEMYRLAEKQLLQDTIKKQKQEIDYLRKQVEALIEIIKENKSDG